MCIIWFRHGNTDVCTSAWTAAPGPDGGVEISYLWSLVPKPGSFASFWTLGDSRTGGVRKVFLDMDMAEFSRRLGNGSDGVVDLR
jgi:hypothetical protein